MTRSRHFLRTSCRACLAFGAILLTPLTATPVLAADATIDQVYAEARNGDVNGALAAMDQVLKDHPQSAKAHFVDAELLSRAHQTSAARGELAKAQSLAPGLPFASPRAVGELTRALNGSARTAAPSGSASLGSGPSDMPWGVIVIIGLVVFGFLALLRRRAPAYGPGMNSPMQGGPMQGGPMQGGGYGGQGYGPGYGGGMGAGGGLLGGLARGAAMGAGFAAGEEVIGHMFGGGMSGSGTGGGWDQGGDPNADMGGQDFGISDAGSWGDSSGGGDGGW